MATPWRSEALTPVKVMKYEAQVLMVCWKGYNDYRLEEPWHL